MVRALTNLRTNKLRIKKPANEETLCEMDRNEGDSLNTSILPNWAGVQRSKPYPFASKTKKKPSYKLLKQAMHGDAWASVKRPTFA